MKNKLLLLVMALAMTGLLLCGCSPLDVIRGNVASASTSASQSGAAEEGEPELEEIQESVETLTVSEERIKQLTEQMQNEMLSEEELQELAGLYAASGQIRLQRDMLELCYSLYGIESAYETLQSLTVNLEECSGMEQALARGLMQNLELGEDTEAVFVLYDSGNTALLESGLGCGIRSYYLSDSDTGNTLVIQVGYESGDVVCRAWYRAGEQVCFLKVSQSEALLIRTSMAEDAYQGGVSSWYVDASKSYALHETGTLAAGVLSGDYTASLSIGGEATELPTFWQGRELLEPTDYTGSFDEAGLPLAEQLETEKRNNTNGVLEGADQVIYAYGAEGKDYLFLNVPQGTELSTVVFGAGFLGLEGWPSYTEYDVQAVSIETGKQINTDDLQFRVFDGVLEYYDGLRWNPVGFLESVISDDPVAAYWSTATPVSEEIGENGEGENQPGESVVLQELVIDRTLTGQGSVAVETAPEITANTDTTSGNDSKPAGGGGTPSGGGDISSGSSAPSNGDASSNSGTPSAGDTPPSGDTPSGGETPSGGDDVDVGWSDDFL